MSKITDRKQSNQCATTRYDRQRGVPPWVVQLRIAVATAGGVLAPIFYPPTTTLLVLFVSSYLFRMWATEAIYHRYFSHRSYQASRGVQFLLAVLGTQSGQRGPLWWGSIHRVHHQVADSTLDPHSPTHKSFSHAFIAWLWDKRSSDTDLDAIPDFARFRELRWLNKNYALPFYGGGVLLVLAGQLGWLGPGVSGGSALLWGFFLPVTAVLFGVALVNSTAHSPHLPAGFRRYQTRDHSVNRPLLALITLGGGWHNNHHRYAVPARAGFAWWELDVTYVILVFLETLGVVRNVKRKIPDDILREGGL
jgi:stearoyl-CoA desaturase (delta-9 desaturase)